MEDSEFDFINSAIKIRINKEIKEIKKLYQAIKDGEKAIIFHSKCDKIPYTLIVIKSAGNRRFGGFTTQTWDSIYGNFKDDKYALLFSLDKQKIYDYMNDGRAIYAFKSFGPTFGNGPTLYISNEPITKNNSFTHESNKLYSYNFYGDDNALSEDGHKTKIHIIEYEVFQIIFN